MNYKWDTKDYVVLPLDEKSKRLSTPIDIGRHICSNCNKIADQVFKIAYMFWCIDCLMDSIYCLNNKVDNDKLNEKSPFNQRSRECNIRNNC